MRKSLTLFAFVFLLQAGQTYAQSCVPDPQYADSTGFVFPFPYHPVNNPEGGIDQPACIDQYYEFVWTIKVPEDVTVFGLQAQLEYLKLDTVGAVSNLPIGMDYLCNPPDCMFNVNEPGCVLIYGTPTNGNTPGIFDLAFEGFLKTVSFGVLPVMFPDENLYPGNYYLELLPPNDPGCLSSIGDPVLGISDFRLAPNPITDWTVAEISSSKVLSGTFEIYDLTGRQYQTWSVTVQHGVNHIPLDLSNLKPGYWLYRFGTAEGLISSGSLVKISG